MAPLVREEGVADLTSSSLSTVSPLCFPRLLCLEYKDTKKVKTSS